MRVIFEELDFEVNLVENNVYVLSIEDNILYQRSVRNLYNNSENIISSIRMTSEKGNENFSKQAEVIINPFDIDINNKKILNAVYKEISTIALEEYTEEILKINAKMLAFITKIIDCVPYELEFADSISMEELLKAFTVKYANYEMEYVELLFSYIKAVNQVLKKNIIFLVGIKNYLTNEELDMLYKMCFYEKIKLVLVEHSYNGKLNGEKNFIIDRDKCIIEV